MSRSFKEEVLCLAKEQPKRPDLSNNSSMHEEANAWIDWATQYNLAQAGFITEQADHHRKLQSEKLELEIQIRTLKSKLAETESLADSYRRVIDDRKGHTVFPPGSRVAIGPEYLEGEVLSVTLYEKDSVVYQIGYWLDANYVHTELPASQVYDGKPLPCVGSSGSDYVEDQ